MSTHSKLIVAAAGLAALGACSTLPESGVPPTGPTAADNHTINVIETGERLEIAVSPADMSLSLMARNDVVSFARSYARWGHGTLVLSMPSGGANADAVARLAQQVRMTLADNGVPYLAINGAMYDASGREDAPIVISFMRFEAQGPDCAPLWTQDLAHPRGGNQAYESFGCATVSNLAVMVEDPRDLIRPRDEDPRDAGRRDVVLGHYREGEQTHAIRTPDERVTISNAVR